MNVLTLTWLEGERACFGKDTGRGKLTGHALLYRAVLLSFRMEEVGFSASRPLN